MPWTHMGRIGIACLIPCLVAGSCDLESQKPKETFVDGTFPESLEKLANPIPSSEQINAWQDYQASHPDYLRVGVIDNGVDYLHPDLFLQSDIDFDRNGSVRGVGRDIFGADFFPYPRLVDPILFAFGSEAIVHGKIQGPLADPIARFDEMNQLFAHKFDLRMETWDSKKFPLLAKINSKNFSLVGAINFTENYGEYTEEQYELFENEITIEKISDPTNTFHYLKRYFVDMNWVMSPEYGYPYRISISYLLRMEGIKEFRKLVDEVLAEVEVETSYEAAFETLIAYGAYKGDDNENSLREALNAAWYHHYRHPLPSEEYGKYIKPFLEMCERLSDEDFLTLHTSASERDKRKIVENYFQQNASYIWKFEEELSPDIK